MSKIKLQAHRGLSTEYPENTLLAFQEAINHGYKIIELDPKITRDNVFVFLHDSYINRTGRNSDGSKITEKTLVSDLNLAELKELDFGFWKDEKFEGTKIPVLSEVLTLAGKSKVLFKFDNCFEKFTESQVEQFFSEIKLSGQEEKLALTCSSVASVKRVTHFLSGVEIHYDGIITEKNVKEVEQAAAGHKKTFWIPYPNELTRWCDKPKADEAACKMIKTYGDLGIWILKDIDEYQVAQSYGADAIETNGQLTPVMLDS